MVNDETLNSIVRRFEALDRDGVMEVGSVPRPVHDHWSELKTDLLVITGERKDHYHRNHQETKALSREILQVLLDPDEVHRNRADPDVAILWRLLPTGTHYLRAMVRLATTPDRDNSLISIWQVRRRDYDRAVRQGRRVWKRV